MTDNQPVFFSIVIPVYNGSQFLEETIASFINQTYKSFEMIFVNDGSTDNSLDILERYAQKDHRIKVFSKQNEGTAAKAVKYGLLYATGLYFMYSSQDDLVSPDLLEKGYKRLLETNADAVVPDMIYYYGNFNSKKGIFGIKGEHYPILNGREAFAFSIDFTISGFVIWRMSLVKKIGYFDYGINSDEYTARILYFNSLKVAFFDGIFYYRQNNPKAITKKWDIKFLDFLETDHFLEQFAIANDLSEKELNKIRKRIFRCLLNVNRMFLSTSNQSSDLEKKNEQTKILKAFKEHLEILKSIKTNGIKEALIKFVTTRNYFLFNEYARFTGFILRFLKKNA
jgi:glycosyltransferase involved in cell wall biosynthesis